MGRLVNRRIMLPYSRKYRILRIYLPENYDRYPHMRFPVLYMFDGQNLYEDELAYGGVSWGIKKPWSGLKTKVLPRDVSS